MRSRPGSAEKKYFETYASLSGDNTSPTIVNLCLVPQGTTDVTRIANKIDVVNVGVRVAISMDDQTTGVMINGHVRMIIYVDKQCNGASISSTDLLKQSTITNVMASYRNLDNVDRFLILTDEILSFDVLSANALHTLQGSGDWRRWKKKCKIPVHYSSTTGAITELKSNNIGVFFVADNSVTNITYGARIKFYDS